MTIWNQRNLYNYFRLVRLEIYSISVIFTVINHYDLFHVVEINRVIVLVLSFHPSTRLLCVCVYPGTFRVLHFYFQSDFTHRYISFIRLL